MSDRDTKRLREAGTVMAHVLDAMYANDVPIDSCILAGEIAREAGRALGYRARIFPVRVRVSHKDGREGHHIGYRELSPEALAENRYPGHVLCLWDDKVGLDATAPQMDPDLHAKPASGGGMTAVRPEAIPALAFPVPREFVKRQEGLTIGPLDSGWVLDYEGFDDGGEWARNDEIDAGTRRSLQHVGAQIAKLVRS